MENQVFELKVTDGYTEYAMKSLLMHGKDFTLRVENKYGVVLHGSNHPIKSTKMFVAVGDNANVEVTKGLGTQMLTRNHVEYSNESQAIKDLALREKHKTMSRYRITMLKKFEIGKANRWGSPENSELSVPVKVIKVGSKITQLLVDKNSVKNVKNTELTKRYFDSRGIYPITFENFAAIMHGTKVADKVRVLGQL